MAETTEVTEEKAAEKQDQQSVPPAEESKTQVQSVELSEVSTNEAVAGGGSIDILLDMDVPVAVIIGQTEIPVRRLLQLCPGSVLNLDKSVDAPAELYLKDIKFATGNVVVVEGRFAVRIKQMLGLGDSTKPADAK